VIPADDYIVFDDASPGGPFTSQTGTAVTGAAGLTIGMPAGNRYYLVAGTSAQCGLGLLH
jgi:hypothetical protein